MPHSPAWLAKHFSADGSARLCARCQYMRPVDEFGGGGRNTGSWCRGCRTAYQAARVKAGRGGVVANPPRLCRDCAQPIFQSGNGVKHRQCDSCRSASDESARNSVTGERRLKKYGTDGAVLLAKQGGRCAICGVTLDLGLTACVDHCHSTGVVRGILCSRCDQALGLFADDPARIARAAEYLVGF